MTMVSLSTTPQNPSNSAAADMLVRLQAEYEQLELERQTLLRLRQIQEEQAVLREKIAAAMAEAERSLGQGRGQPGDSATHQTQTNEEHHPQPYLRDMFVSAAEDEIGDNAAASASPFRPLRGGQGRSAANQQTNEHPYLRDMSAAVAERPGGYAVVGPSSPSVIAAPSILETQMFNPRLNRSLGHVVAERPGGYAAAGPFSQPSVVVFAPSVLGRTQMFDPVRSLGQQGSSADRGQTNEHPPYIHGMSAVAEIPPSVGVAAPPSVVPTTTQMRFNPERSLGQGSADQQTNEHPPHLRNMSAAAEIVDAAAGPSQPSVIAPPSVVPTTTGTQQMKFDPNLDCFTYEENKQKINRPFDPTPMQEVNDTTTLTLIILDQLVKSEQPTVRVYL
ncbi:hypothetical protein B0H66DRAFT_526231 [Apodospora peruviana]|uniref:Uncharacterized protein n=1 Tax=Apodospora peruviana TaxID=516989 RepID=A0AAE0MDR9_9PEZI|nr:hypothetical protein B0H66DRAFT_526231 [Apodospora peruviana]